MDYLNRRRNEYNAPNGKVSVNIFIKSFPDSILKDVLAIGKANECKSIKDCFVLVLNRGINRNAHLQE